MSTVPRAQEGIEASQAITTNQQHTDTDTVSGTGTISRIPSRLNDGGEGEVSNSDARAPSSGSESYVVQDVSVKKGNVKMVDPGSELKLPWGAKWRSSSWFITSVVTLGVMTDILTYTIVVPVLPYRLQALGYTNISALTSWLLFAYSIGIFICTLPVAYFFHKYPYRRSPLVAAIIVLEVALVLFTAINTYWVMVLSRFIQGAASTIVWSVGFALICENVPEKNVGRQIGFAYSGVSVGSTIAPPIGGALYQRLGWHAPFIFCIIICAVDLILRLFVIEQKDLREWQEKHNASLQASPLNKQKSSENAPREAADFGNVLGPGPQKDIVELSPWEVLITLLSNKRGMTAFWVTFVYGMVLGVLEPTLTLRVQEVWHKDSDFVGLVYLAAAAPTFFAGPVIGALADKYGSEWIILPSLTLALPWLPLMGLKSSLAGFMVFFALAEVAISCAAGPAGLEVTMVARETVSDIDQFAAMNIAFAISTSVGAVVGGQMYDHISNGWWAVIWLAFGIVAITLPFPFFFTGNRTFYSRLTGRSSDEASEKERGPAEDVAQSSLS
ncbi:hypothetical protein I316_03830 [Kwoniella heveanensis BCC8398]|uniref:Major facilitator superfamily (MFS) profile domain-containing protein n=1 Tax=Kwoniella heveanensis BCC8398 TaxID=1296120 RepID=A0A1B9GTH1_9TREE|nr:hypothetical protein I316_03830 [Kwoniella heveanensis BCC8398]